MTEEVLDELLSRPTPGVLKTFESVRGDVVVLGAGGKMGPSLSRMTRRALDALGRPLRVIAVSRFTSGDAAARLASAGAEVIQCDLTDRDSVARLPHADNVIFMAGQKFGTNEEPSITWAVNTLAPAIAAERYKKSRIVAFSTGNVYPFTPVARGGSQEGDELGPVGEYAGSCAARERMLEYHARRFGTPMVFVRLNYANALRYGVLTDIAVKVLRGVPVDVAMGYVNVIWQGDANARALQCLARTAVPPSMVNVTGPEIVSVRAMAARFGELLGRLPKFAGTEAEDALLSNTELSEKLFGPPVVSLDQMIEWTAEWVRDGGALLGKPTHFETRDGVF
ncbi:MAG: NAD-dependent epimerase/dehydratase family protein [Gemmatimonadaceae bacterium]